MTASTARPAPPPHVEQYRDDEIVVDLPYLSMVKNALAALGVALHDDRERQDARLGLALLAVAGLDGPPLGHREAATAPWDGHWSAAADSVAGDECRQGHATNLDVLLKALRIGFAAANDGWFPPMGKNRVLSDVEGLPYISGGSAPKPPQAAAPWPAGTVDPETGRGVRIGVLDTPFFSHPEVEGRYVVGRPDRDLYRPGDTTLSAAAGHSVFIAGLVLRRAPGARLHVEAVLSEDKAVATTWDVATAMVGLLDEDIDVLVTAFGCHTADREAPLVLARAVERITPDILIVAAAGNHGDVNDGQVVAGAALNPNSPTWPAALDQVVAVGAHDGTGAPASFSPVADWVRLSAPGVDLVSTYLQGKVRIRRDGVVGVEEFPEGFATWNGTSFAVAVVAGEIAARTVPGRVSVRDAVQDLLDGTGADRDVRALRPSA